MKTQKKNIVWDPFVRMFHWVLVINFTIAYFSQIEDYSQHIYSGYLVLGLVVFRLIWGVIGSFYARFSNFIYSPGTTLAYFKDMLRLTPARYMGHNPAGGYSIILMLLCLLVITISGIALDGAENRAGLLADTTLFLYTDHIRSIHDWSTYLILGLIVVHFSGVIFSSVIHKENLVLAMFTGRKKTDDI